MSMPTVPEQVKMFEELDGEVDKTTLPDEVKQALHVLLNWVIRELPKTG